MHVAFSDDQLLFRDTVRDLLASVCPPSRVRAAWEAGSLPRPGEIGTETPAGREVPFRFPVADVWAKLAGMGVVGLAVPEGSGGMGLGMLDLVLLLEEAGRAALPAPLVETAVVAGPVLPSAWASRVAAGDAVIAVALDPDELVPFATAADAFLLLSPADGGLHLIERDAAGVAVEPVESVDRSRSLGRVSWTPSPSTLLADAAEAGAAFDRGALGTAAVLCGLGEAMLDMAVSYAKERRQFGVPIGSQQAVKHHLANATLKLHYARPLVHRAAWSIDTGDAGRSVHVSMAKAAASDAAAFTAKVALQVHGAIGYAWEHDLHLFMKRTWALAAAWGDASWQRRRVLA